MAWDGTWENKTQKTTKRGERGRGEKKKREIAQGILHERLENNAFVSNKKPQTGRSKTAWRNVVKEKKAKTREKGRGLLRDKIDQVAVIGVLSGAGNVSVQESHKKKLGGNCVKNSNLSGAGRKGTDKKWENNQRLGGHCIINGGHALNKLKTAPAYQQRLSERQKGETTKGTGEGALGEFDAVG